MKILVTGSEGFIGKNLCLWLKKLDYEVLKYDLNTNESLSSLVAKSDFIFHLAGVNRPTNVDDFYSGNANLTLELTELIESNKRIIPICLASSTQASLENDYGKSKKLAEEFLLSFYKRTGNPVYIFRLQNVFGKWCKPNYNSVVATFCFNIANGLPVTIDDPKTTREFVYIDDVCRTFVSLLTRKSDYAACVHSISPSYVKTIGEVYDDIVNFRSSRENIVLPNFGDEFISKLYSTYVSYLNPNDGFAYKINSHTDSRGSFSEIFRTIGAGQLSLNVSKPGITKGNHFHQTKNEKFIVVHGQCCIKFRKVGTSKVYQYLVDGNHLCVVDIPCGYTHSITNIGEEDSVTLMWASELYDPQNPDTYYEEV